jgi:hypothetical protein
MWSSTNAAMKVRGLADVEVEAGAVFFFFDSTILDEDDSHSPIKCFIWKI